jgi:hypothetical protein
MHATQMCGMEKGRRRIVRPDFLVEFSRVVGLGDSQLHQLRWALAHDQVLVEASAFGLSDAALELLSVSLHVERELGKEAVAGIRRSLRSALRSQRELCAWEASSTAEQEEGAMT